MKFLPSAISLFKNHRSAIAVLTFVVGLLTGGACVCFHYAIGWWTYLMTGYFEYTPDLPRRHGLWPFLGPSFLIIAPILSALLYGPLIARFAPSARGHGIPEVMLAVRRKGGVIPGQVGIVKLLGSALTIGGGGSAGREGPVVQIGAALGSCLARVLHLETRQIKLLATCGAAAGIAATFNAPLAGAVFGLEVILLTFNAESFGMVVISAVGAALISHAILGDKAVVSIHGVAALASATDLVWVALLGAIGGMVGVGFSKLLYAVEDLIDFVYRGPSWACPVLGSILLGLALLAVPQMYGSGATLQEEMLIGSYSIGALLLLGLARGLFTSFTIGIGGSGGVFAPSLFIGAALGCALGQGVSPIVASDLTTFGVIGMGAVFAGAARAPITAVLIIVEMTGQYALIMPLMLAVALATGVSRFLTRKTIYTEKLARRGDMLDNPVENTVLGNSSVTQLMEPAPVVLEQNQTLAEASRLMHRSHATVAPVVQAAQGEEAGSVDPASLEAGKLRFCGTLSSLQLAMLRASNDYSPHTTLTQVELDKSFTKPGTDTSRLLSDMIESRAAGVPVVQDGFLLGWISQVSLVKRVYRQQRRAIEAANAGSSWGSRFLARHPNWPHKQTR